MALLGAYLTWYVGTALNIPPCLSGPFIVALFFVYGMGLHWVFMRFRVAEMASMLITFTIAVFLESVIQAIGPPISAATRRLTPARRS